MKSPEIDTYYIAFLRGINVGGHHKLPMAELKKEMGKMNFRNVSTLLNSGNIIFEADPEDIADLESRIASQLQLKFGFPVPTIIRTKEEIHSLYVRDPFKSIPVTKDIRLYISFLKHDVETPISLPWTSPDKAFSILEKVDKNILSVLDVSVSKTPKAMAAFDQFFGSDITTRNWKTIGRVINKLDL